MSALSNAFFLIHRIVDNQAEGLHFTALNEGSGIPQGSAHRIVKELVELNVLDYDPKRKTYRGGLMLASLGSQVLRHYSLRKMARPSLEALHDELGQVVTLGIRDETQGIYIDKIEATDMGLRLHSEIGKTFPLHCTAMGKVLLAHANEKLQRSILKKKLTAMTLNTITDPARLSEELEKIRQDGYAIDNEEITRGLVCTAAPVFGIDGAVAGAVSFTCQKHTFEERKHDAIIEKVIKAAALASA